jgi:precorrin-6Y C5,15-methyltransferase (decarboxylating)
MNEERRVHVVGVEPEGPRPDYFPLATLLPRCGILAGGKRHIEALSDRLPEGARLVPITNNVPEIVSVLEDFVINPAGKIAVVLATGDPLYHGIGGPISRAISREHVAYYPATTLVQRAFSLLGEPWEDVQVGSIHGKKEDPILSPGRWIFYTGGSGGPAALLEMAARQGFRIGEMTVLEGIGLPGQKVTSFRPPDPEKIREGEFQTLNMVVMTVEKNRDGIQHI